MKQTLAIAGFLVLITIAAFVEAAVPLEIKNRKLDRKIFDPRKEKLVVLSFEIGHQANVNVRIYDWLGKEIRTLTDTSAGPGKCSFSWDGKATDGKIAKGSVFLYVIEVMDKDGTVLEYNPVDETSGKEAKTIEFTYDNKTGKTEYVLPKTCMVRLRAGLTGGMLATTIMDWQPQIAGRHSLTWDGKDTSGLLSLSRHPELSLNLTCYRLPENTILFRKEVVPFSANISKEVLKKRKTIWSTEKKYLHYRHNPVLCHEPRFSVTFPNSKTSDDGTPVLLDSAPVRVEIDKRDKNNLIDKRFEIMLYVDGVFIFEMEEGTSPFTFNWNTQGAAKGPHVLTVNVMSYDDHIGVVTQKVILGG